MSLAHPHAGFRSQTLAGFVLVLGSSILVLQAIERPQLSSGLASRPPLDYAGRSSFSPAY